MTVSTTINRISYTANGSNDTFAYPFRILAATDLAVYVITSGTAVLRVLNTHYTVTGAGVVGGGNVVFGGSYIPANNATVLIIRDVPDTQTVDLVTNDRFPSDSVELGLDKLTLLVQDLVERIGRATKLPLTGTLKDIDFPAPGADEYIKWNAAGTALETNSGLGGITGPQGPAGADAPSELSLLDDVNVGSMVDGEVLTYDAATQKWINKDTGIGLF